MKLRDRIKELRRVSAADLRPNAKNWREHPAEQKDALRGVLAEVGIADALIARELEDGSLELIDGHLRTDTDPAAVWPVLVLDVTADEADKLLATFDPLAAMAQANATQLDALLRDVETSSEGVASMLAELAAENGIISTSVELPNINETTRHTVVVPYDESEIPLVCKFLGVDKLPSKLGKVINERIKELATATDS